MSYEGFHRLEEQPFSNAPNGKFYYNTDEHGEAMARIFHSVETNKGLTVMIGDSGTGKTLLARRMLAKMEEAGGYEAAMLVIVHTEVTAEWLLKKIATQIGVSPLSESKGEIISQVYEKLLEHNEQGRKCVIIIDEANMLQKKEIYEEFRGLLNLEIPGQKLVNIVLLGVPDLEVSMSQDPPLVQRIAVKFRLRKLGEDSTKKYVVHRMKVAGSKEEIFSEEALGEVFQWSGGVPRLINTICDNALLEGYLKKKKTIDAADVREVGESLGFKTPTQV